MSERGSDTASHVKAGSFSEWLRATLAGLRDGTGIDVPCGTCDACCKSSYFIHISADETAALAAVGSDAIPAPGRPGQKVMGHKRNGACPKMSPAGCAIYANRPRTCRTYDCRVFAAAGLDAGADKPRINERIASWRFEYPTRQDEVLHEAVQAVAAFIRVNAEAFPGGRVPTDPGELALLALVAHDVMLPGKIPESAGEIAQRIVDASRAFA